MLKLRAKKRVQSYKSLGRYIRAVYNANKELLDDRIKYVPSGKTVYETFRDQVKEHFIDNFVDERIEAYSSKNKGMAIKAVWQKAIDKAARSTLITPSGKGYEEQVLEEFFEQASKGEKAMLTRAKRKKTQNKKAIVTDEDMEYIGYDNAYSYFEFDEYIIQADNDPSPKGPTWKKYRIVKDKDEIFAIKSGLIADKIAKTMKKVDERTSDQVTYKKVNIDDLFKGKK